MTANSLKARALLAALLVAFSTLARSAGAQPPPPPRAVPVAAAKRQQLSQLDVHDSARDAQRICAKLVSDPPAAAAFSCSKWQATHSAHATQQLAGKARDSVMALANSASPVLNDPTLLDAEDELFADFRVKEGRLRVSARRACGAYPARLASADSDAAAAAQEAEKAAALAVKNKGDVDAARKAVDAAKKRQAELPAAKLALTTQCQPDHISTLICGQDEAALANNLRTVGANTEAGDLDLACGATSSGGIDFASLATSALQGLGDYLTNVAKQELIDFALARFGKDFCKKGPPFDGGDFFPITCAAVFPKGLDDPPDTSVILSGKLPGLLQQDADNLPASIVIEALGSKIDGDMKKLLQAVLANAIKRITAGPDVLTVLQNIRDDGRTAQITGCTLTAAEAPKPECALGLYLEVAGEAKDAFTVNGSASTASLQYWLETATKNFCVNYSSPDAKDGSCVLQASDQFWTTLDSLTQAIVALYDQLYGTAQQLAQAVKAGRFSSEAQPVANSQTSDALRVFLNASLDAFELVMKSDASWKQGGNKDRLARSSADLIASAAGKDTSAVLGDVADIVANPLVSDNFNATVIHSISFVVALGQAKTRDDARKVIEDAAAPIGTYRAKFAADTIMVNGYVGFFGLARTPLVKHASDASYVKLSSTDFRPLSAPVGLEFSGRISDHWHSGIAVLALDPLAIIVQNQNGTYQTDFKNVFTPGLLGHVSIYDSPVDFVAGVTVQPTARSAETCSENRACWRAPVNFLVGLSVDVPILQLE